MDGATWYGIEVGQQPMALCTPRANYSVYCLRLFILYTRTPMSTHAQWLIALEEWVNESRHYMARKETEKIYGHAPTPIEHQSRSLSSALRRLTMHQLRYKRLWGLFREIKALQLARHHMEGVMFGYHKVCSKPTLAKGIQAALSSWSMPIANVLALATHLLQHPPVAKTIFSVMLRVKKTYIKLNVFDAR